MRKDGKHTDRRLQARLAIALAMSFGLVSAFGTFTYAAEMPGNEEPAAENSVVLDVNASSVSVEAEEDISGGSIIVDDWILEDGVEYDGEPVILDDVSVFSADMTLLEEGVDYEISYYNNDCVGTATLAVTGIGRYYGELSLDFEIVAPYTGRAKASNIKYNRATLTWTEYPAAAGYNIYCYSMFDADVLCRSIASGVATTCNISDLKPNTYYFFTVVPYVDDNGTAKEIEAAEMWTSFETPICYDGRFYASNTKLSKSIGKVLKSYKECTRYKGAGECYGYADWASKKIAKSRRYTKINKKLTAANVKKYICTLKPGAHVRISGHSVVILKASREVIYWADNNYRCSRGRNRVHYWTGTPDYFARVYHSHAKIEGVYKTLSYR